MVTVPSLAAERVPPRTGGPFDLLSGFGLALVAVAVASFLAQRTWRSENEVNLGPLSVPLLTAIYAGLVVALTLLSGGRALRLTRTRWMYGGVFVQATLALSALGVVSTMASGGGPYGYAYYSSFLLWPLASAGASRALSEAGLRRYVAATTALLLVGLISGSHLRVLPDNVNLTGMIAATNGLIGLAFGRRLFARRTTTWLVVGAPGLVLMLDGRRTLIVAYALAVLMAGSVRDLLFRRGKLLAVVLVGSSLVVVAGSVNGEFIEDARYAASALQVLDEGERAETDGRRARLLGYGIELIESAPVAGVGGGRYLDEVRARQPSHSDISRPHNMLVFVWAELGLVGVLLALVLLVAPLVHFARRTDAWVILVPSTVSMFTNDYYFSPGYFLPLLILGALATRSAIEGADVGGN